MARGCCGILGIVARKGNNLATQKEAVRAAIKKAPNAGARTIARGLHLKYPQHFTSIEKARTAVRSELGLKGKAKARAASDKSLHRPKRPAGFGANLQDGLEQVLPPLVFNDPGIWLNIGDIHFPYQDKPAVCAAVDYGLKHGCTNLYINGDCFDFHQLSRFNKEIESRKPDEELEQGVEFLRELAEFFPGEKVFKMGNHEDRYETYLRSRAPDLAYSDHFALKARLKLDEMGYKFVASKQYTMLGRLPVLHGHELPRGFTAPVNPAKGIWNKLKDSALCNHFHRRSGHDDQTGITRRSMSTHSVGCLCKRPAYDPFANWDHGFAIVIVKPGGDYTIWNKKIINGEVTES